MIKKFTKFSMPLVLLLSSKAFCNQMPSENMPDCPEVNLIEQSSMPNPEDALRNCCKEKCKKCKCEKFCKLLVSKNLKTESLSVVKNATVGGNLAVTGSTTLNGYYPVLNQYEQIYNLRGIFSLQPNTNITFIPGALVDGEANLTTVISPSSTIYSGEGFTVSDMTCVGTFFSPYTPDTSAVILSFSAYITFNKPFTKTPTIVTSLNMAISFTQFDKLIDSLVTANNIVTDIDLIILQPITLTAIAPSPTGFKLDIGIVQVINPLLEQPTDQNLIEILNITLTQLMNVLSVSFVADGVITPSAPVCPTCPTVKPCCR